MHTPFDSADAGRTGAWPRWAALVAAAAVAALWPALAGAADAPTAAPGPLPRVTARLMQAAGPWCGRWAELDTQGARHCRLAISTFNAGGVAQGAAFLGSALLTDALVHGLDEPELALVLGHEVAHIVLGHGSLRAQAAAATPDARRVVEMLASLAPLPHPQAPTDLHQQENDADALGLVLAGLAGYPVAKAAALWQQRLPALGVQAAVTATHPSTADRARAVQARALAFCAALHRGAPVLPAEERLRPDADYRHDEVMALQRRVDVAAVCAGLPKERSP